MNIVVTSPTSSYPRCETSLEQLPVMACIRRRWSFVPVVYDKSTVVISAGNAPAREGPRTRSASWYGPVELGLGEGTSRSCRQNLFCRTLGQTMLIYRFPWPVLRADCHLWRAVSDNNTGKPCTRPRAHFGGSSSHTSVLFNKSHMVLEHDRAEEERK